MPLRIGFGRVDITPPVGVELSGFGPYLRRRSTSVHRRIHARAIAVDDGRRRWVLVSADLLGLSKAYVDESVGLVARETGWAGDDIAVHLTHSHSGPATIVELYGLGEPDHLYLAQLPDLLARAGLEAVADLAPARVARAEVPLDGFAHNRMLPRRGLTNELALSGSWSEPETGLIDSAVHVLRVEGATGLRGFVAYYSCHPVICCEQTTAIHGDFPGEALALLAGRYPSVHGVFIQGALGDINPLYAHGPAVESYEALARFGGRFADAVGDGIEGATPIEVQSVAAARFEVGYELAAYDVDALRSRRDEADAIVRAASPDEVDPKQAMAAVVRNSLSRTLDRIEGGEDIRRPVYAQALRLGPITLVGFNLELFHGIKRRLQGELGAACWVMSTTNGWLGYAPTRGAYAADADPYPAYEVPIMAGLLPFRPDIEDTLVAAGREAHAAVAPELSATTRTPTRIVADSSGAWWREAVVYECHLPSFRDGNGDGIGDLDGLIASLDYLGGTLGIDAIWTGPFYRSPLLDQGFDVADYTEVEPTFGSLETFDRLITEAHQRGIRIIVDFIPNHTSDQHPWFVASRSSRTSSKRDWYVWRDPRPDGGPPNNWTSEAGGSAWEWDDATGQYYLHSHLKEQPELNWRNPEVRAALLDVLRFWLDRGADGVRIDVAHMLMKDPDLRDNPEASVGNHNPYDLQHPDWGSQLHLYDRRHPDTFEALAQIRTVADEFADRVTIAEIEAMEWADWAAYYGGATLDAMHLPFPFRLLETPWRADSLRAELNGLYAALPVGAWPIVALGNHDRSRLATRLGPAQARVAAVLLLTLAATPCLLYADELGMTDQSVSLERQRDYFARATGGVSRDPVRTPMPWSDDVNAGFSAAAGWALWLPTARDAAAMNVEKQASDPGSFLSLYRRLLRLRRSSPALLAGAIDILDGASSADSVLAYVRRRGDDRKIVALNLTDAVATVDLPEPGTIRLSTTRPEPDRPVPTQLRLDPNEAVVIDVGGQAHEDH